MLFLILLSIFTSNIPTNTTNISWYGGYFNGRITTCGETFWEDSLSVASPILPMGTVVRFWRGTRQIDLIVNDGGPYAVNSRGYAKFPLEPHPTRGFDFSKSAFDSLFQDLDMGIAYSVEYAVIRRELRDTMKYNLENIL